MICLPAFESPAITQSGGGEPLSKADLKWTTPTPSNSRPRKMVSQASVAKMVLPERNRIRAKMRQGEEDFSKLKIDESLAMKCR